LRYAIRAGNFAASLLFCLIPTIGQAQQGSATVTPSPQSGARAAVDLRVKASERAIDETIPNDPAVAAVIAPYGAKVRELDSSIGKLVGELKKSGVGAGSLGNFVADALRSRASAKLGKPVLLAITNSGGLRKSEIAAGDLTANDIYQLLPFENALVALDLTGEQLRRFLDVVVAERDAQSGAKILFRTNEKKQNEIVQVRLTGRAGDEEIDPKKIYTIVTNDYLVKRGGDYRLLQEARRVRPVGETMRDAVIEYVKAETAAGRAVNAKLDGRFRSEK